MPSLDHVLRVYLDLADWHERHGPPHVRDRFLILAADAALNAGREDEAERLRQRLLQLNPHHMFKPFASFTEALRSPDVDNYVNDLKQSYPPEVAEDLLREARPDERPVEPPPVESPRSPVRETAPPRETLSIPPTLPVVDIDSPPRDPVVVYWDDTDPVPDPAPKPRPLKRPTGARQPPRTATPPRAPARAGSGPLPVMSPRASSPAREFYPPRAEPARVASSPVTATPAEEEAIGGSWVSYGLFGLVLAASLALAVRTLVFPLLPPEWLAW